MIKVVIIGMGLVSLRTARALAGKNLDMLVIDRRIFALFQPLLDQAARALSISPTLLEQCFESE